MTGTSLRAIILDFDGTLIESVGIKDQAFQVLFKDYPEHLDAIMAFHLAHNHTIRFEKFEHIHREILRLPYPAAIARDLAERFSLAVVDGLANCPYVPGAREFLESQRGRTPLYLVSMSPAGELDQVLAARDLVRFFRKVYAHPWQKAAAVADILTQEGIEPQEVVFVGDTDEDCLAARQAGVLFLGRDSGRPLGAEAGRVFRDMHEIRAHLDSEFRTDPPQRSPSA